MYSALKLCFKNVLFMFIIKNGLLFSDSRSNGSNQSSGWYRGLFEMTQTAYVNQIVQIKQEAIFSQAVLS